MDYIKLRDEISKSVYSSMSDPDAANYMNTTMVNISAGIISVNEFMVRAMKVMVVLLAASKGDAIRSNFEGLLGILATPGVTTIDMGISAIINALEGAAALGIGGFTHSEAVAAYTNTVTLAFSVVGEQVSADDINKARR